MQSEIQISKSGAEVLVVHGLATASLVNPEREAANWADSQMSRISLARREEPIVVIGVGSGFHLRALQSRLKDVRDDGERSSTVFALDSCSASVEFSRRHCVGIELIHVPVDATVESFVSARENEPWIRQSHTLLKHRATIARGGESLKRIEEWSVGRTPRSFSAHLKLRPQIASALDSKQAGKIAIANLLSVRDLAAVWDISSELKTDRRIFRVLEELVR